MKEEDLGSVVGDVLGAMLKQGGKEYLRHRERVLKKRKQEASRLKAVLTIALEADPDDAFDFLNREAARWEKDEWSDEQWGDEVVGLRREICSILEDLEDDDDPEEDDEDA